MYSISNANWHISARSKGAELTSLKNKTTGIEHLWQADPAYWGWHAPVLFPVVGRCLNDEQLIDGKAYRMEKHGFARKSDFACTHQSATELRFTLQSNEQTRALYPYEFEFTITYRLDGSEFHTLYSVRNTGNKNMFFQLGAHPAFAVPFLAGEVYEDYELLFEQPENIVRHLINTDGYFTGEKRPVLQQNNRLPLRSDLFEEDALIFKDHQSRALTIRSLKNPHYLRVKFGGFPYLGLWAKTNADYVCIEPWYGCADTAGKIQPVENREGILTLQPGETFNASFTTEAG